MARSSKQGGKGRKHGRNSRWGGVTQTMSAYRQRRNMGVPRGGNGGAWRGGNIKPLAS